MRRYVKRVGMVKENDDQMKLIKENLEHELYAKEYLITLVRPDRIPTPRGFNSLLFLDHCLWSLF